MIKQTTLSTLLFPIVVFLCLLVFYACKKEENAVVAAEDTANACNTGTTDHTGGTGNTETDNAETDNTDNAGAIDPTIYDTDKNGITLHKNNRIISVNLGVDGYNIFIEEEFNRPQQIKLVRDVYKRFKDDFDFVTFVLNQKKNPEGWVNLGFMNLIQSYVQNIGTGSYNFSEEWGSEGRLKGAIMLPTINTFLRGPTLLHEIVHLWGNYLIKDLDYMDYEIGPHWGVTGGDVRGQLGGFQQCTLVEKPETNDWSVSDFWIYDVGTTLGTFSEFELYLMGFIPLDLVTPFDIFRGISKSRETEESTLTFTAASKKRYTPEIIRNEFGVRTPLPNEAQKDFKMLVIVVTGTPITALQWKSLDKQSELFGKAGDDGNSRTFNFWEATKGMGTMKTGNLHKSLRQVETTALEQIRRYDLQAPRYDLRGAVSSMHTGTCSVFH